MLFCCYLLGASAVLKYLFFFLVEKYTWFLTAAGPEEPREFFFLSVLVVYAISETSVFGFLGVFGMY